MNSYMRIALNRAVRMLKNPKKTQQTIENALKKSKNLKGGESTISQIKDTVGLFFQMIFDYIFGKYKKLPFQSAVKILAALIYFLFLVDAIPDFLAVIGLVDDAAVLAWVVTSISSDVDDYKQWKEKQPKKKNKKARKIAIG